MSDFLMMGGYGAYVWAAFGFTTLAMLGLLLQSWLLARRRERELDELRRNLRPRGRRRESPAITPSHHPSPQS